MLSLKEAAKDIMMIMMMINIQREVDLLFETIEQLSKNYRLDCLTQDLLL